VRELDGRRGKNLVRQPHGESSRLAFIAALRGSKELGPRRSRLAQGLSEILSDYRERDTGFEPATFGLGMAPKSAQRQRLRALATTRATRPRIVIPLVSPCRRTIRHETSR
jgi:hypothetical protein